MDKTRVFIVDDHPIVRRGLSGLIAEQRDLEVCGEAASAEEALQKFKRLKPDLAIVDISLGGMSGLELIKQMKERIHNVKILVSSMHDELLFAERCLRAGAAGYLNKQEPAAKLIDAIRSVLEGKVSVGQKVSQQMLSRVVKTGEDLFSLPEDILSDRELEVFEMIGRGLSIRGIAETLHLSPKTIESYRERIAIKLGLPNSITVLRHAVLWVNDKK